MDLCVDRKPLSAHPDLAWSISQKTHAARQAFARATNPVELMHVIETLEKEIGREAEKNFMPMQPGDVPETYADVDDLIESVGFAPNTSIEEGIARFVEWYRGYFSTS